MYLGVSFIDVSWDLYLLWNLWVFIGFQVYEGLNMSQLFSCLTFKFSLSNQIIKNLRKNYQNPLG